MTVLGLLLKGFHGEEYLVASGSEAGDVSRPLRIFQREPQGWVLASLSTDEPARVRAEAMIGIYKMARQLGVGVPRPPQGIPPNAF